MTEEPGTGGGMDEAAGSLGGGAAGAAWVPPVVAGPLGGVAAPARVADPGSPGARSIAWVLLIPLLIGVIWLQHGASEPAAQGPAAVGPPAAGEPFTLMSRMLVKIAKGMGKSDPNVADTVMGELEPMARTPQDRLRLAVVAAELKGPEEGLKRIDGVEGKLAKELDEAGHRLDEEAKDRAGQGESGKTQVILQDILRLQETRDKLYRSAEQLRTIYTSGNADGLDETTRRELVDEHGWFGKLALVYGKDDKDPARAELLSGGMGIAVALVVAMMIIVLAILAGFVLFIVMVIMAASGKLKPAFRAPAPGGSVYLETVVVFLAGFLLLKAAAVLVERVSKGADWAGPVHLLLQWAILPVIFWPVVRGVPWRRLRMDMGWHTGRGFFREVGAGIVGYLAGLPVLLLGAAISLMLYAIKSVMAGRGGPGGQDSGPMTPENPIFELVSKGSPLMLFLLYTLATLWAPIVEEAVFRGALFRHLRSRVKVGVAAVLTALMFGVAHGYELVLLGPVIALGFVFALLREWRGSLIAPMTGHLMHNGFVLAMLIVVMGLLGK